MMWSVCPVLSFIHVVLPLTTLPKLIFEFIEAVWATGQDNGGPSQI
jgi:hypothetical protein